MSRSTFSILLLSGLIPAAGIGGAAWLQKESPPGVGEATSVSAAPCPSRPVPAPDVPAPDVLAWGELSRAEIRSFLDRTRSGTSADVPDLESLALSAPDAAVAANAIRALGRLGRVTVSGAVAKLLDDPRPRVRQEVVIALGRGGDRRAVGRLAPLLTPDADTTLRALAIQALGRIGGEEASRRVRAVLDDPASSRVDRAFARNALVSSR